MDTDPGVESLALTHRHLLAEMIKMRVLTTELRVRNRIAIGDEAVTVGVVSCTEPRDAILTTHRRHRRTVARGVASDFVLADLFRPAREPRATVAPAGLPEPPPRLTTRVSLALALELAASTARAENAVTVCFVGGSLMSETEFHAACALATTGNVPVLFCSHRDRTSPARPHWSEELATAAARRGVPGWSVDGMDVLEVRRATGRAIAALRAGGGPLFLEFETARTWDPPPATGDAWPVAHRDPIRSLAAELMRIGAMTDDELAALWLTARRELSGASRS